MYAFHRISFSILGLSKWKLSFVWLKYWNYARFKEILFMNIIWKQKQVLPQTAIVVLGVKDNLSARWSLHKYQSQENVFRNRWISRRWQQSLDREWTIIDKTKLIIIIDLLLLLLLTRLSLSIFLGWRSTIPFLISFDNSWFLTHHSTVWESKLNLNCYSIIWLLSTQKM